MLKLYLASIRGWGSEEKRREERRNKGRIINQDCSKIGIENEDMETEEGKELRTVWKH